MPRGNDGWIDDLPELVRAAARGDAAEVERLLSAGIPPDQATTEGWSALHAASARGHVEVVDARLKGGAGTVEKLIAAGADVTIKVDGEDAEALARKHGHHLVAEIIDAAR